jgi:hypothetical protein
MESHPSDEPRDAFLDGRRLLLVVLAIVLLGAAIFAGISFTLA